jgi:hypothetical protein
LGEFNSDPLATVKYKVGIAGGAGILAFAVALGIIHYAGPMKSAFQIQKKYVRVIIAGKDDGFTPLEKYTSDFTLDGASLPAARSGSLVEIFVPYFDADKDQHFAITGVFYSEQASVNSLVEETPKKTIPITIPTGEFGIDDGSYDFPKYSEQPIIITFKADNADQSQRALSKNSVDQIAKENDTHSPAVSQQSPEPVLLPKNF